MSTGERPRRATVLMALAAALIASACSAGPDTATAPVGSASVVASPPAVTPSLPSGTPTPRAAIAPLPKAKPLRLRIPEIGVDSGLMDLGLMADGSLEVPPKGFPAGWFTGGPTPGELGPAVIAGHVDFNGPGVFHRLHELSPGDLVLVRRADGSQPTFRVSRVSRFPKDRFPTTWVYGDIDHAGLRLITCGGTFDGQTGHYRDNIVVFAELVIPGG